MEMMDLRDPRQLFEKSFHLPGINPARDGIERKVDGIAQQSPSADENYGNDDQTADRIEDRPAGPEDDETGDDDAGRDRRVRCHVEEGRANIEIALASPNKHPGSETI